MIARKSILTAAVVLAFGGTAAAADYPTMPAYGTAPQPAGHFEGGGCPTCGGGAAAGGHWGPRVAHGSRGCSSCGSCGRAPCDTTCISNLITKHNNKKVPFAVNLCPGACFGYFQTQWRKWDEVCPYPYQGTGVTDAPKPPSPHLPSVYDRQPPDRKGPGGVLPDPRPVKPGDPMPMPGGLPPIPNP